MRGTAYRARSHPERYASAAVLFGSMARRGRLPHMPGMLWRITPKDLRRPPPAGFILPCRPLLVDRPPSGLGWLTRSSTTDIGSSPARTEAA